MAVLVVFVEPSIGIGVDGAHRLETLSDGGLANAVGELPRAFRRRVGRSVQPGRAICDGNVGTRNTCTRHVSHNSGDCSGRCLRVGYSDRRQRYQ